MNDSDINKLIDYILLNAYSVGSTGFYNGKAGLSLCLFEMARLRNDERLEEHAFELLQESLLTKNNDISFENGLSGIGFVLLYLINHHFIEADFHELFHENLSKITDTLNCIPEKKQLSNYLNLTLFLSLIPQLQNENTINSFVIDIFTQTESLLLKRFVNWNFKKETIKKEETFNLFENYLKCKSLSHSKDVNNELLEKYAELYQNECIASRLAITYYLSKTDIKNEKALIKELILKNERHGISNIYPEVYMLFERLNLLYMLDEKNQTKDVEALKTGIFNTKENELEVNILSGLPVNCFYAGFEQGVARLLLYYAYVQHRQTKMDYNRFKYLF